MAECPSSSSDAVFASLEDLAKAYEVAFDSKKYKESASGDSGDSVTEEEVAAAYEILGITVGVPMSEVKSAYKHLLRKHHPDAAAGRCDDVEKATVRTQLITAAYYVIVKTAA
jgi:DnaJ-class molecular chaperone